MDSEPLFTLHGPDGHVWKVFENGRATGFPDGTVILNHAAALLNLLRSKIGAETLREMNVDSALIAGRQAGGGGTK